MILYSNIEKPWLRCRLPYVSFGWSLVQLEYISRRSVEGKIFHLGLRADMSIVEAGMVREMMQDEYSGSEVEERGPEESETEEAEADDSGAEVTI